MKASIVSTPCCALVVMARRVLHAARVSCLLAACCVVLAGMSAALAAPGGAPVPRLGPTLSHAAAPGVPQDYVVTPFGYFHPSCVRAIGADERILADGRVVRGDGTAAPFSVCRYAHYTSAGMRVAADARPSSAASRPRAPEANGWVEASWYNDSAPFGGLSADWIVPPAPEVNVGQVVYFFPGLEDYENVVSILQPVLGWNGFNDSAWSISSWNCCVSGYANYSGPVAVASGDAIHGVIKGDCPAGQACPSWDIVTRDVATGKQTTLAKTGSYGQRFDWAMAGVLEVYGVSACAHYPKSGYIDFTAVVLDDLNLRPVGHVPWTASGLLQDGAPACNYSVGVAPSSASLTF
jgi:hypothetical protein